LASELVGGEWSVSRFGRFTPEERAPGTHWIGGWVDHRVGLDDVEKRKFLTLPGLELQPLSRPTRSQSLYRPLLWARAKTEHSFHVTSHLAGDTHARTHTHTTDQHNEVEPCSENRISLF
jgi:hypothetical protein